jgi:hypothetical protein
MKTARRVEVGTLLPGDVFASLSGHVCLLLSIVREPRELGSGSITYVTEKRVHSSVFVYMDSAVLAYDRESNATPEGVE